MRHFTRDRSPFRVRLACVKHAASVQSEPESNSPVQICSKDLRWTEIRISKFLPVRYSLVNEPRRSTRREAVVYAASFSLSTSFFISRKFFFAAPPGQLIGAKETYVSFSNPRQELFCHPGKSPSPSPLRTWPVRWRERLYAPFRPHRQAFFRKKFCGFARFRRIILPTYRKDTEKCWHFFFQTPSSPHAKASCRQYQDVPAMSPAPCISARSRCKAATLPTSPLAGTSSSLTDCPASPQTPLSQPMQYRPSGRCISPDGTHPHGPVPGHEKSRERSPLPGLS